MRANPVRSICSSCIIPELDHTLGYSPNLLIDAPPPDEVAPYLHAADLLITLGGMTRYEPGSGFLYTKECRYLIAGRPIGAISPSFLGTCDDPQLAGRLPTLSPRKRS